MPEVLGTAAEQATGVANIHACKTSGMAYRHRESYLQR
jgi:hypothetical protein